jgi:hypothetical protein
MGRKMNTSDGQAYADAPMKCPVISNHRHGGPKHYAGSGQHGEQNLMPEAVEARGGVVPALAVQPGDEVGRGARGHVGTAVRDGRSVFRTRHFVDEEVIVTAHQLALLAANPWHRKKSRA